jgi:CMP-N,N'-diacetyllegionaminic acid synthase
MTNRILSIIPARGGSQGLPRKNVIDLAGKPLIAWTIDSSLNSKYITKTVVSSDDREILDLAVRYGADTIKRPSKFASNIATSESVVKHVISYLESRGEIFDIVILLQPTSPLRSSTDVDNAIEMKYLSGATAVISTYKFDNKILKTFIKNSNGFLKGVSNNEYPFTRRQDLPLVHMPNGAIYIIDIKSFKNTQSFMTDRTVNYPMSKERSVDVDTYEDLILLNKVFNKNADFKKK